MYIKFLAHGKGDPAKAASYLIDEVDHLNRPRADVQVLRGDPQTFTAIAESIQNEWIYTSGVIAWSKSDNPSDAEINEVLDSLEKHAFAGLQPHQYHFTAVLHEEDDGSKHVHFLVPRVELDTGKALNIAPPGHDKYFDPLRDYFNYSKGWSRPDDPDLQRDTQTPDHIHFQDKFAIRAGLKDKAVNDIREIVGSYIEQRIEHGFIRNRKDVLDAISELGKAKPSDEYIALKLDGAKKAIRLKGAFYESEFTIESYFENRARKTNDARASNEYGTVSAEHRKLAEQCRTKFIQLENKRSAYNRERYQSHGRSQVESNFSPSREPKPSPIFTASNERNIRLTEPTATTAQAIKSSVRSIEQHEPRHSRESQTQESPFYIKYSFSFDSSYFDYQQFFIRIRQQEQIQRYTSDAEQSRLSEKSGGEHDNNNVRRETVRRVRPEISRHELRTGQWNKTPSNSERDTLNEARSTVIENYRRSTASVEATTAEISRSIGVYSGSISEYRAVKELHEHFKQQAQRSSEDSAEISEVRARTVRANYLSKFFTNHSRELESTATNTFERFSAELTDRKPSQNFNSEYLAEFGPSRDRTAIEADDRANNQENDFSRAISTKISGINPTDIFKALDVLDQRKELQREQERQRSRDYDSPSPF
ncbi:relaxase/mobilization nuclease domain-containing protein [Acinetobacter baumannii]|uniref:relaxase/mobilization nuclease domain-containing protein n=3 Tax=Acinetobacter TaxID=469 RepID=UPI0021BDBB23|nr:relaxase/mobilization nuclease domain-containing protein [Acinetobacter lwoffii]MCT9408060.1 relaxase/mobilization nuclease domain-containing protein [Acinetobacter baumannii]MCU4616714.1 relaxase/mobilization nuclease domain-containing protein [Acinetobacter lwoffii]